MKNLLFLTLFLAILLPAKLHAQNNQDKLDLPGDNLNLFAVLKLFQESETLEGFERKLNEENSEINNLDLNGDDKTDYIKVIDNTDGNVHTIVLQVDVNANEKQDVAVFTVQKDPDGKVQVQLIGDEELYGKNYIIEPNTDDNVAATETPNPGYAGNTVVVDGQSIPVQQTSTVVVASWPMVRYIYLPTYTTWRSPWYWNYYPSYWRPWRPLIWHAYWGYHSNYNSWYFGYYRRWPVYRYNRWNDFYFNQRRVHSVVVYNNRQNGIYRNTYLKPETRQQGIALYNKRNPGGHRLPTQPVDRQRPITRPVKPTRPSIERPTTKPVRPITRPITRPAIQKPVTRPVTKPAIRPTRPAIQPAQPRPAPRPAINHRDKNGG
jgi:hypothetical protein